MDGFMNMFLNVFLSYLIAVSLMLSASGESVDTINTEQAIVDPDGNGTRSGSSIISSGGYFELGFFSPDSSSKKRYLGIWYKKISAGTVVWVANRDNPITDSSGTLKISEKGVLTLSNGSGSVFWSSNATKFRKSPVAQLLDSGNLVVREASDDNPENYLWQSFDYPGDTLLPGMKLGIDLETGLDRYLLSWKSINDPSGGPFTFRMDTHGFPQEFIFINGSIPRFRSGPWNGLRFSGSPGLKPNSIYRYHFEFNNKEIYYMFDLINSSVLSRLVLNSDGDLQRLTWNYGQQTWILYLYSPSDNCDKYAQCPPFGVCNIADSPICSCLDKFERRNPKDWEAADWTSGCARKTPLDCKKGDKFLRYSGVKLPDTRNTWYSQSMTLKECENLCLSNCSCMAYANTDITKGNGCILWFADLIDIVHLSENGQDIYIRVAASEIEARSEKVKKIRISLGVVAGVLLGCLCICLYSWHQKKKQQQLRLKLIGKGKAENSSQQLNFQETESEDIELPLFELATIFNATNNFSSRNKLGEGGFGPVYRGILQEGQQIAVKRLSRYSIQGLDEFKNEVMFIAKLQHRNLVKLLGCCIEADEKMLVYEYMPNGSLDTFIFDKCRRKMLDWPRRFNIINGIARGLLYLHQDSRLRIIHRDLKAANILLDDDMNPKISDFGMARVFGGNESEANTKRIVGTYGYMSPEYAVDGVISLKADVFSFGVLVLEIISSMKNRGFYHPDHHHNLLGHAWILHKEGRFTELIDTCIGDSCNLSEVIRSIHVALLCVQQSPEDRPNMAYVVLMLCSDGTMPKPKEPGFFTERNLFFEADSSSSKNVSASEFSITMLEAR